MTAHWPLTTRPRHPTFVDLPWETPLAQWDIPRLVTPARGISRHVVPAQGQLAQP